jgi:hypothetical protein
MLDLVVLEMMRSPKWFLEFAIASDLLAEPRDAMLAVGRLCFFDEGVKLFATPADVHHILYAFAHTRRLRFEDGSIFDIGDFRPRHVVLSRSLETVFLQALASTPGTGNEGGKCKDNVKVRRRACLLLPRGPWRSDGSDAAQATEADDKTEDASIADQDADSRSTDDNVSEATVAETMALSTATAWDNPLSVFVLHV